MVIPPCSVCKQHPDAFPVLTCETCWGKTVVCQNCASVLQSNPSNPHKNHRFRIWLDGLWFDWNHLWIRSLDPPTDQFGQQWSIQNLERLNLGYNAVTDDAHLMNFLARPHGQIRLGLVNVPAGRWEVALQISTWPSPAFGEKELKQLRFTKKLSVHAGTTNIGVLDCFVGNTTNMNSYLDLEEGSPAEVSLLPAQI